MKTNVSLALATLMLAGASLPANAADLYIPPVVEEPAPLPVGGWYLRGSIGMSNQSIDRLSYEYFDVEGYTHTFLDDGGFDSAPTVSLGFGYQANDWLRGDITAEYRGKASFNALDRVVEDATGFTYTNNYEAKKSEWLFLANAYADLGNFHGIVPYIGAGIGTSRNTISHFTDDNSAGGGGFAGKDSEWDLAWALHAGLGYQVTDRMTVDFGYSFVNLGDGSTAPAENYDPMFSRPNDGFKFEDITSHDFKLGLRYAFN
ncbi:outer membrane protein [Pararhizobium haloflavum]|uniref:outer membrane protein n=1 Tax=Pararhizobium haloflavum TaxID=2037914 RepID=UPI000C177DC6|nr:outer membrane protein [Pararhizobium haloflavum]